MEKENKKSTSKKLLSTFTPYIIGIVIVVLFVVGAAIAAYSSGVNLRLEQEESDKTTAAVEQFELALLDLSENRCDLAYQRFEYIINEIDPEYPGIVEKMSQAILCKNTTATATPMREPTATPVPTLTPTPDFRQVEEIFNEIPLKIAAGEYDEALMMLDNLRKNFPDYKPVEVDGLYFTAFRERGEDRIIHLGLLESGIFDLSKAESFGPIDAVAENYRSWASWYLVGLSFWDLNWDEVYYYFDLLNQSAPFLTLREDFGDEVYFITAQERLSQAKVEYAPVLKERAYTFWSDKQFCDGYEAIRMSNEFVPLEEPNDLETLAHLELKCEKETNGE